MGAPARILVVEDDVAIRDAVTVALVDAGWHVAGAATGGEARQAVDAFRPDVLVLDVRLPEGDDEGLSVARFVRDRSEAPILFLTAADEEHDRLAGFGAGGDDYVVKPFLLSELVARIGALLRRAGASRPSTVAVADLIVDEPARVAARGGRVVDLTRTEFALLAALARHRGTVLSKEQLLDLVWEWEVDDPNVVERHVSALRRKLEAAGPRLVHTVRGVGYVLRP